MKKKYNESAEDYLETILMLSKTLPVVRAVDIATCLLYTYDAADERSSVDLGGHRTNTKKQRIK